MKVSVVVTVLNESNSISNLIESLVSQKRKPNEIIIVDGGSTDETAVIIRYYAKKYRNISYLFEPGNISHGRNIGIQYSKNEIIALIDAGCVAKYNWLELLSNPFKDISTTVVAGFYEMVGTTNMQRAVGPFLGITPLQFNPHSYIPSARSMAFRKKVWKELNGFDERLLLTGEDTLFNYNLIKKGNVFVKEPRALVEWEVPKSFIQTLRKFFNYAKGDAQTGIWWNPVQKFKTHNLKILTIYMRYFLFICLLLLFLNSVFPLYPFIFTVFVYLVWVIWKMRDNVQSLSILFMILLVQISSDVAVMLGFFYGLILKPK